MDKPILSSVPALATHPLYPPRDPARKMSKNSSSRLSCMMNIIFQYKHISCRKGDFV